MRKFYLILICGIAGVMSMQAQDATWFTDVTAKVGFTDVPAWRLYASDVNGDDYPDLLIINGINKRNQLSLWLNMPDPEGESSRDRVFVDVTEESGINKNPIESIDGRVADVGVLGDIDNDGDVDLITGRFYYQLDDYLYPEDLAAVMLNDGAGHFTHVEPNGIDVVSMLNATSIVLLDYNLDGNLDAYVGTFSRNHAASSYMEDFLFEGRGDGRFTDRTQQSRVGWTPQPLYGANACDWNNDGWTDVIASPYCRTDGSLWLNLKNGTFKDVAFEANFNARQLGGDNGQNLCEWEAMPADFDNDGDMDLLQVLVHGGYHPNEGRTVLAVNGGEENGFRYEWQLDRIRRDAPVGAHIGDMSGSWVDLDNDGFLDLIINQSQYPQANVEGVERSYFLLQNDTNYFDDITEDLGLADDLLAPGASELIDYDLDGDDDLMIVINTNKNQNNSLHLIESHASERNNWIGIRLDAPEGVNHDAIGAKVFVEAGGNRQKREIYAGHGHFGGQGPLRQNFGVGSNEIIDRIEVHWPHASLPPTIVENVAVNQTVTVQEDGLATVDYSADADRMLRISPNPVRHRIAVTVPDGIRHTGEVVITNAVGQTMLRRDVQAGVGEFSMDVTELAGGYYLLHMSDERGGTYTRPFIVQ